jgi:hypothetical protein
MNNLPCNKCHPRGQCPFIQLGRWTQYKSIYRGRIHSWRRSGLGIDRSLGEVQERAGLWTTAEAPWEATLPRWGGVGWPPASTLEAGRLGRSMQGEWLPVRTWGWGWEAGHHWVCPQVSRSPLGQAILTKHTLVRWVCSWSWTSQHAVKWPVTRERTE